jgi:HEPN domain-containing protein
LSRKGLTIQCDAFLDEKVLYWLDLADYDIESAKVMLKGGRYLYVGFMCHQTIEKALKAVIARDCTEDDIPPKTHNLIRLSDLSGLSGKMTLGQASLLEKMNPLNIEARYPDNKSLIAEALTKEYCKELVKDTEDLLLWIKQQL